MGGISIGTKDIPQALEMASPEMKSKPEYWDAVYYWSPEKRPTASSVAKQQSDPRQAPPKEVTTANLVGPSTMRISRSTPRKSQTVSTLDKKSLLGE